MYHHGLLPLFAAAVVLTAVADEPVVLTPLPPPPLPPAEALSPFGATRLAAERATFTAQLASDARHDPSLVRDVVVALQANQARDIAGTLDAYAEALVRIYPAFAEGEAHFQAGRWGDASLAWQPLFNEVVEMVKASYQHNTMPPYPYAAARMRQAEAQARSGDIRSALIGYQVALDVAPGTLSLGNLAALRTADLYARTGRGHFAIPFLSRALRGAGAVWSDRTHLTLEAERNALANSDPFRIAPREAAEAAARLARGETGVNVQEAQQRLVGCLRAMLVLAETEDRPFLEHTMTLGVGAESGRLDEGTPPADFSVLPGEPERSGDDDWARLRPRERQRLLQAYEESVPPRYRDMLDTYYRTLSDLESQPSP